MKQLVLDIRSDAPARFDSYVVGDNAELVAALHESALAGSGPLYLWGPQGSGKSHLLQATVALASASGRSATLLNAASLGKQVPSSTGLLAIDDVEALPADAQVATFNAFNRRGDSGLTLLLSGHRAPRELELREDLRTRIGQTLIFEIRPLDESSRREILIGLASRRGIRLEPEVLDFILRHGRRDLQSLLVVFEALDAASLEHKRPITLPLLRGLLQAGLNL